MTGRWDSPRPVSHVDAAVDQQRRDAEAEAQRNMTDATYEPEGESDVR